MKNYLLSILLLFAFDITIAEAYSDNSVQSFAGYQEIHGIELKKISINGPADFKNVKFISGSVTGDVDFEDLTVTQTLDVTGHLFGAEGVFQKLHVIGSLRLSGARMEYLEVTGPATLKNCSVTKKIEVIGSLKATNSTLHNVDATVTSIILHGSKADTIIVRKNGNLEQQLILNNSSAKNVIFESGNGKVLVIGNAEITGKVKGAIIVQK